jgi:hypothetical protein
MSKSDTTLFARIRDLDVLVHGLRAEVYRLEQRVRELEGAQEDEREYPKKGLDEYLDSEIEGDEGIAFEWWKE